METKLTPQQEAEQLQAVHQSLLSLQNVINALQANPNSETNVQVKNLEKSMVDLVKKQSPAIQKQIVIPCLEAEVALSKFITTDPKMLSLKNDVRKIVGRNVNYPILIHGESGTGKELIAHALHGRKEGPFVAMNCAALSPDLIASELFGHRKGSFTGAIDDKIGLMQYAAMGTLFLDEIGDMNLDLQAKLLRAIQEKKIRRLGDTKEIDINCQIVCASHRKLDLMVEDGTFRLDLYKRLSVIELFLTPLRERKHDIKLILTHFNKDFPFDESMSTLPLTGNVRDLETMVKRWEVFGRI